MERPLQRSLFFLVAALLCFVIALLIVLGVVSGSAAAWTAGGFVAFVGSFLPL